MSGHHVSAAARVLAVPELLRLVINQLDIFDHIGYGWQEAFDEAWYTSHTSTLYRLCLVNRLWHDVAQRRLYCSIVHIELLTRPAQLLGRLLARNPHIADMVRHARLDIQYQGAIPLLAPLACLQHLAIDCGNIGLDKQLPRLDDIILANQSARHLKSLTLRFSCLRNNAGYEDTIARLVKNMFSLTHLCIIDADNVDIVQDAISALPRPKQLVYLEIDDHEDRHPPSTVSDTETWRKVLSRLSNVKEVHLHGPGVNYLLGALPRTTKILGLGHCDLIVGSQLLLHLADRSWLPRLEAPPSLEDLQLHYDAERRHQAYSRQDQMDAIDAAIAGIEKRERWRSEAGKLLSQLVTARGEVTTSTIVCA